MISMTLTDSNKMSFLALKEEIKKNVLASKAYLNTIPSRYYSRYADDISTRITILQFQNTINALIDLYDALTVTENNQLQGQLKNNQIDKQINEKIRAGDNHGAFDSITRFFISQISMLNFSRDKVNEKCHTQIQASQASSQFTIFSENKNSDPIHTALQKSI